MGREAQEAEELSSWTPRLGGGPFYLQIAPVLRKSVSSLPHAFGLPSLPIPTCMSHLHPWPPPSPSGPEARAPVPAPLWGEGQPPDPAQSGWPVPPLPRLCHSDLGASAVVSPPPPGAQAPRRAALCCRLPAGCTLTPAGTSRGGNALEPWLCEEEERAGALAAHSGLAFVQMGEGLLYALQVTCWRTEPVPHRTRT